eukprot:c1276_g1_i1.p1 GENE.c1276_g1_i1~~c1276_g1_i1.p1  ORF type:complete len:818 (+),score=193.11 c1276_g1_i1:328-2454(+)
MSSRSIANVFSGFAVMSTRVPPTLWTPLIHQLTTILHHASVVDIATILWSFAKIDITPDPNLMLLIFTHIRRTSPINQPQPLSYILWAISKLRITVPREISESLEKDFIRLCPYMNPRQSGAAIKAISTISIPSLGLLTAIDTLVVSQINTFDSASFSNLYLGLTKLQHFHPISNETLRILQDHFSKLVDKDKSPNCIQLLIATTRSESYGLEPSNTPLVAQKYSVTTKSKSQLRFEMRSEDLVRLFQMAVTHLNNASIQDVVDVMWCFAKLDQTRHIRPPSLLQSYSKHTVKSPLLPTYSSVPLTVVASIPRETVNTLKQIVENRAEEMDAPQTAVILWALSCTASRPSPAHFSVIYSALSRDRLIPMHIAFVLRAHAKLQQEVPTNLMQQFEQRLLDPSGWSAQAIANMLWSLAVLRHLPNVRAMNALDSMASLMAPEMRPQAIANIFWSFASLDHSPSPSTNLRLMQRLQLNIQGLKFLEAVQVLWAMAVLNLLHLPVVEALWDSVITKIANRSPTENSGEDDVPELTRDSEGNGRIQSQNVTAFALFQLCHVHTMRRLEYPTLPPLSWKTREIEKLSISCFDAQTKVPLSSSMLHLAVCDILTDLHISYKTEVFLEGCGVVDVLIPSQKIVIEIDGPNHYMSNNKLRATGKTLFKRRVIRRLGYHVVAIPYFEWSALPQKNLQRQYLEKLLKQCESSKLIEGIA